MRLRCDSGAVRSSGSRLDPDAHGRRIAAESRGSLMRAAELVDDQFRCRLGQGYVRRQMTAASPIRSTIIAIWRKSIVRPGSPANWASVSTT